MTGLEAGFGVADITPPLGIGLAGFGPFLQRRASSIHSPLYARAFAVRNGSRRWVIVSCDLIGHSASMVEEVRTLVTERTGWSGSEVAVHATHSHAGPATGDMSIGWGEDDPLYRFKLPHAIADALCAAIGDLAPATVRRGSAPLTRFAHNRTKPTPGLSQRAGLEGTWTTGRPHEVDSGVDVLSIETPGGALRGIISSYSCHLVVASESTSALHGDFAGEAMIRLESAHPDTVALFLQGALGDIDPNYAHGPDAESFAALEIYALRFADAVELALGAAQPMDDETVGVALVDVDVEWATPARSELQSRLDEQTAAALMGPLGSPGRPDALAGVFAIALKEIIRKAETGGLPRGEMTAHALRLGAVTFTGVNAELYHGIKREHQRRHGAGSLLLSTTNGWLGYAPTADAFGDPGSWYATQEVPLLSGHLPFTPTIAERILAASDLACDLVAERSDDRGRDSRDSARADHHSSAIDASMTDSGTRARPD